MLDEKIDALNVKSSLAYLDYFESLKSFDYNTLINGVNYLLDLEKEFFFLDDVFLDSVIKIITIYNDKSTLKKLLNIKSTDILIKEQEVDKYLIKEYFKRGFIFDYVGYLDLLELDDLLINEEDYSELIDSPYIIYSINYLKREFADYYLENRKADNYLLSILKLLSKEKYSDVDTINKTLKLFKKREDGIITFRSKIK